jgi:hypothetical protein
MSDFNINDYTKRTTSPVPHAPQRSQLDEIDCQLKSTKSKLAEATTSLARLQVANEQRDLAFEKLRVAVLNLQLALGRGKKK